MLQSTEYASIKLLDLVKSMYGVPRFGRSNDIALFFSEDASLRNKYMIGLIFVFAIIMGIAALWFIILIILRLLGYRVGCASGAPATIPAEPIVENQKDSVCTDETGEFIVMQGDQNRVNRTRILFFLSIILAVAASAVFLKSSFQVQKSLQNFYEYSENVRDKFAKLPESLDVAISSSTEFQTPKDEVVADLTTFCPTSSGNVGGQDPSEITANLTNALNAIPDLALEPSFGNFNASMEDINDVLDDAVSFMSFLESPMEPWFISLLVCVGVLLILIVYLFSCAWRAGKEGYVFAGDSGKNCNDKVLHRVAIPLFSLLLAGVWFVTSVAFASSTANADFCYSEITTGNTVLSFLRNLQYDENSTFFQLVDDYLYGCTDGVSAALPKSYEFNVALSSSRSLMDTFISLDVTELDAACSGDATSVMAKVQTLSTELDGLITDYSDAYDNISCETIAPLMQKAVYEVGCNSVSSSLLWTFASGLCLAIFGTIVLSLRSATQRPEIYLLNTIEASEDGDNSYIEDSYY